MIENIWGYEPIVPLAVAAAAVFGLGAAIHLIQAIYYRTKFFVAFIVGAFTTAGGGAMISVEEMAPTGKKLEILGLALQLLSFCLFLAIAIVFRIRIRKTVTEAATKKHGRYSWKTLHSLLMAAAVLIIIRATYRIIEFSETEVFV
ncbi:unnamed protein product, partial [Aureobasidium pullulans]